MHRVYFMFCCFVSRSACSCCPRFLPYIECDCHNRNSQSKHKQTIRNTTHCYRFWRRVIQPTLLLGLSHWLL